MSNLIDLSSFRSRNGLSQAELGSLIGTTGSFISQVENGNSKMPADKMATLWSLINQNAWFADMLVPALTRLELLKAYIECDDDLGEEEKSKFRTNLEAIIPPKAYEAIQCGQMGIDRTLAERIISISPKRYIPTTQWLVDGQEPMFKDRTSYYQRNGSHNDGWHNENEEVLAMLKKILEKLDKLEGTINKLASNGDTL